MNMRTESKEKKEYVLFVLDESGSMGSCKKQTINGFNEQLQELNKTKDIKTFVSLVKFNSGVTTVYWNKPLEEVEYLTVDNYNPCGSTAMLDAVGQSVNRLRSDTPTEIDDVTFLVIIVSDGEENVSKEYTWETVKQLITKCKEDKAWTITYMGSNQDLSQIQRGMNIDMGNTMVYTSTGVGTQMAFNNMTTGLANYRSLRMSSTADQLANSGVTIAFYSSVDATDSTTTADTI